MEKSKYRFVFKITPKEYHENISFPSLSELKRQISSTNTIKAHYVAFGNCTKEKLISSLASIIQYCQEWLEDIKKEIKSETRN